MPLTTELVKTLKAELNKIKPTDTEGKHATLYLAELLGEYVEGMNSDKLTKLEDSLSRFCATRKDRGTVFKSDPINSLVMQLKTPLKVSALCVHSDVIKTLQSLREPLFKTLDDSNSSELTDATINFYAIENPRTLITKLEELGINTGHHQYALLLTAAYLNWHDVVTELLDEGRFRQVDILQALERAIHRASCWSSIHGCHPVDKMVATLLKKLGKGEYSQYLNKQGENTLPALAYQYAWPDVLRVLAEHEVELRNVYVFYPGTRNLPCPAHRFNFRFFTSEMISSQGHSSLPIPFTYKMKYECIKALLDTGMTLANEQHLLNDVIKEEFLKDEYLPQIIALLINNNLNLNYYSGSKNLYALAEEHGWEDVKKALIEKKYPAAIVAVQNEKIIALEKQVAILSQQQSGLPPAVDWSNVVLMSNNTHENPTLTNQNTVNKGPSNI